MLVRTGSAWLGGRYATDVVDVTSDLDALNSTGWWAVVVTYEGEVTCARFRRVITLSDQNELRQHLGRNQWSPPDENSWASSLDKNMYQAQVEEIRLGISRGDFYQVNLCRVLSTPLPAPSQKISPLVPAFEISRTHPAPFVGAIDLPALARPVQIATASPELFLRRNRSEIHSAPIKGTADNARALSQKDAAENIMIVDLVRNDFSRVCDAATVVADELLEVQHHPGLVHLVSHVKGRLNVKAGWAEIFEATFPPGSVTGAPKIAAMQAIARLEPVPRGPYCGAIGWVDADTQQAELAVGIRTFYIDEDQLKFGTGAGITYSSNAEAEWRETELKASRLISLASRSSQAA
ncbi:MAG: anthranilate synthase component I family protein [Actinobacteria bacterium]|nr:anthranilate synthase component I family protein [Actinomycetota bacterium]